MAQKASEIIRPMKLEAYNAFLKDFGQLKSYSRKRENKFKEKYKHMPAATFGSLFSMLVQRVMKKCYRKSQSISNKYYELFKNLENHEGNKITYLADSQGISPALFARSLLQHVYGDSAMTKQCIKDTTLIEDPDLAMEVYVGLLNDNQYGPYADVIKQIIGVEYEQKLEYEMKLLNIKYSGELSLRQRGYDKTPDFKLEVPIAVGEFIVNWVESKALFADEENHSMYVKEQLVSYYNRFGTGMVIYWFGYLETIELTPEVNNMFIVQTCFPHKNNIVMFNYDPVSTY